MIVWKDPDGCACSSSAVIAIGAATLADIFEPAERGTKVRISPHPPSTSIFPRPTFPLILLSNTSQMGVYYMAPLLGPSVASVLGGVLTSGFNWRGPFWFLAIVSGCSLLGFIVFFKDTFRKERSLTYQNILKSRLREAAKEGRRRRRAREKRRDGKHNADEADGKAVDVEVDDADADITAAPTPASPATPAERDLERGSGVAVIADGGAVVAALPDVKVTLRDVNPFPGVISILRRPNNVVMLFSSGEWVASLLLSQLAPNSMNHSSMDCKLTTHTLSQACSSPTASSFRILRRAHCRRTTGTRRSRSASCCSRSAWGRWRGACWAEGGRI